MPDQCLISLLTELRWEALSCGEEQCSLVLQGSMSRGLLEGEDRSVVLQTCELTSLRDWSASFLQP